MIRILPSSDSPLLRRKVSALTGIVKISRVKSESVFLLGCNKAELSLYKVILSFFFSVNAQTLDIVRDRGYIICGVSEKFEGFSSINVNNQWTGFDVDICRAIAAAVLGDSKKIEFVSTTSRSRFPVLASE